MFTRTENHGAEGQREVKIFTIEEGASHHDKGAVHYEIGTDQVTIRSTEQGWGSIPVKGRDNIKLLRDALIAICEDEGIE